MFHTCTDSMNKVGAHQNIDLLVYIIFPLLIEIGSCHCFQKRVERSDNDTRWIVTTSFKPKQLGNGGTYPHYHSVAVPDFRHVYTSTLIIVQCKF